MLCGRPSVLCFTWATGSGRAAPKFRRRPWRSIVGLPLPPSSATCAACPSNTPCIADPFEPAVAALDPDLIVCIGVRHGGNGRLDDYQPFTDARTCDRHRSRCRELREHSRSRIGCFGGRTPDARALAGVGVAGGGAGALRRASGLGAGPGGAVARGTPSETPEHGASTLTGAAIGPGAGA